MKWTASVALACLVSFSAPTPGVAQEPDPSAMRRVAQINPLGFLQFGPNLEVAVPLSPLVSITPGVRIGTLGLFSHLLTDEDESLRLSWTASVTTHVYPEAGGLRGFYVGPRVEAGRSSSSDDIADYDSTILVGAADFGYRWAYPSGFHLTFGGQTGAILESWEGSDGTSGEDGYVFAMLVLGVGVAF